MDTDNNLRSYAQEDQSQSFYIGRAAHSFRFSWTFIVSQAARLRLFPHQYRCSSKVSLCDVIEAALFSGHGTASHARRQALDGKKVRNDPTLRIYPRFPSPHVHGSFAGYDELVHDWRNVRILNATSNADQCIRRALHLADDPVDNLRSRPSVWSKHG